MANPYRCPICNGTGLVPNGFYLAIGANNLATNSVEPERCRSCKGTGIVWDHCSNPNPGKYPVVFCAPSLHPVWVKPHTGDPIPYVPPTICGESGKSNGQ